MNIFIYDILFKSKLEPGTKVRVIKCDAIPKANYNIMLGSECVISTFESSHMKGVFRMYVEKRNDADDFYPVSDRVSGLGQGFAFKLDELEVL